jgi:hypothetical protein
VNASGRSKSGDVFVSTEVQTAHEQKIIAAAAATAAIRDRHKAASAKVSPRAAPVFA